MSLHDIWRGDVMPTSGVDVTIGHNTFDELAPRVPVVDVHHREAVFHDTGAPEQSGIVTYNSSTDNLELIPSQSGAQPITTAVYLSVRNTDSRAIGSLSAPSTVQLNAIISRSSSDHFTIDTSLASNHHVRIHQQGMYEITLRVSVDNNPGFGTATRAVHRIWIERNTGGGWVEEPGSRAFQYNRIAAAGENTAYVTIILDGITVDTLIRGRCATNFTDTALVGPQYIPNGGGLFIKRLA